MEQLIYTPFTDEDQKQNDTWQMLSKYLYHWPLFAIFLFISLSLAFVYLKQVKPIYHVKARLSINDDKDKSSMGKAAALQQLNISTGPKLVESEVEVLTSRPIVKQVVDDLQLWVTYNMPAHMGSTDLYSTAPFRFEMVESYFPFETIKLEITVKSLTQFVITGKNEETLSASFNDLIRNKFGEWRLKPTSQLRNYVGKTIFVNLKDPHQVITDYQGKIATVLSKNAPIIELSIDDEVPERGTEVLNRLVAVYKGINIQDKNKETESTLKFIDERLASLSGELTDVEKNVEGYKSSIGLTDISSKSQFFLDNVSSNDGRLNEVKVQLNVIKGIESYVNSPTNSGAAPATIGITDPGLVNLVAQLSKLQLEHDRLLTTTPETNPLFIPLNGQIASTKKAIRNNILSIKSSLIATSKQLSSFNSGLEADIKSIPGQERKYVSIKRQQGIKETLYIYLLQKREEVALTYAAILTDARTLEDAYYGAPKPKNKLPMVLALLTGLLIPAGIIKGRSAFRNKVLTRKDIELGTSAPVICELIQDVSKTDIVVMNRDTYAIGEQLRALRTSILHSEEKNGKVILFTSSIAREGKSYVSSNIGASMAILGRKTVILELDLRKPQISKIFKMTKEEIGLSNYLNGEVAKEDIIVPSGIHPNLYIMRAGTLPANPSELLNSQKMKMLINELRTEFDNVLIDSPPVHLVTDAMILAPMCDLTLYMVRHNFTPKSEIKFIEQIYRENKLNNLSLIFNGVEMDSRYGYALDYGYYSDKKAQNRWYFAFGNFASRF